MPQAIATVIESASADLFASNPRRLPGCFASRLPGAAPPLHMLAALGADMPQAIATVFESVGVHAADLFASNLRRRPGCFASRLPGVAPALRMLAALGAALPEATASYEVSNHMHKRSENVRYIRGIHSSFSSDPSSPSASCSTRTRDLCYSAESDASETLNYSISSSPIDRLLVRAPLDALI